MGSASGIDTNSVSRRLEVLPSENEEDETCVTYVLHGEDHTLGNALRYVIMKNPQVKFCGYAIPHPSENKINLRIQTYGQPTSEVFRKGLEDLYGMSEHILKTFMEAMEDYNLHIEQEVSKKIESMQVGT
ncbi:DNA-directed RNA polymerases I and III subunit RPAC2-like [Tachypleus tridentatus]|uniref:DNA-directed RNA polymerases I and III subunit RPAC2-like n=1 Tax=Tachypleus tridentatus TaxID=6853 RepID=UPI003FCFD206